MCCIQSCEAGVTVYKGCLPCVALYRLRVLFYFCFSSKQRDLYEETFRDLVENVLSGFNGTIFAYGQTGTGKTFTMQGKLTFLALCLLLLSADTLCKQFGPRSKVGTDLDPNCKILS